MGKVPVQASRALLHTAPLFPVAAGMILGIVLDRSHQFAFSTYVLVFVGTGIIAMPRVVRDMIGAALVLVASMCLGGALHLTTARTIPATSIERYVTDTKDVARVRGVVSSLPRVLSVSSNPFKRWTYRTDRTAFLLDVESIEGVDGDIPVTGRLRVTVHEVVLDLRENEHVEIFGWLYPLRPPQNPGAFDWASFYRRQGVVAGLACNLRENILRLEVRPPGQHDGLVAGFRSTVRGMLTDDLATGAAEEASLLEAMVLGHRSRLDRRLNEVFIRAGCAHFLAVSGTHVVVVMSLVWAAGRLLGMSRRRCVWLMMATVVTYAAVTEPRPPILRATVMALLFCTSLMLGRSRARLNWMSAAAVVLVGLDATTVFDVGFQLSFAAVLGVSFLTPAVREFAVASRWMVERVVGRSLRREIERDLADLPGRSEYGASSFGRVVRGAGRWLIRAALLMLVVSVGAWLAGAPIVATYFHRIQPWGPVSSVIVYPLMSLVMALGFAKIILGAISPTLGLLVGVPLVGVDSFMVASVETLGSLPGASMWVSAPPWWWMLTYYAFLFLFARRFRPAALIVPEDALTGTKKGPVRSRWETTACAASAVLIAGCSLEWCWPKPTGDRLVVTVLAVGAGSATVIELPDGQTMLYDAGSRSPYDVGHSTIVPFLRHRGIRRIDRVYLSHPNLDHFSGLPAIIDGVETGPIIVNQYFEPLSAPRSPSRHLLDKELHGRAREIQILDPSTASWSVGGVTFERLWPVGEADHTLSNNDSSTVLRLSYANHSVLLTGDIEARAQQALLNRGDLRADVLILPHHGSVCASTAAFIAAVEPSVMVRSSQQRMDDTLSALPVIAGRIPLYNTADLGAIEVVIDRDGVRVDAAGLDSS